MRITRAGGHVVFALRSDATPPGYGKIFELVDTASLELLERGDEFQAMPTSEPKVLLRVWSFRVS